MKQKSLPNAVVVLGAAIIIVLVLAALVLLFYNVYIVPPEYTGENPELYTVAINSFLGSAGYGNNGEIPIQSEIGIIETDAYGRVLFYYHEGTIIEGCGYGILQKSQDGYAYFYEDDCVIPAVDDWNYSEVTHEEWFTQEELAEFKTLNDWDQPLNDAKCTKKPIVNEKQKSKLNVKEADFDKVAKAYFKEKGISYSKRSVHSSDTFFVMDDYGREMYVLHCYIRGVTANKLDYDLVIILNPDGSCDTSKAVTEISDFSNYRDLLKEFKQRNGWDTEYVVN